jgi:hypothetical protein
MSQIGKDLATVMLQVCNCAQRSWNCWYILFVRTWTISWCLQSRFTWVAFSLPSCRAVAVTAAASCRARNHLSCSPLAALALTRPPPSLGNSFSTGDPTSRLLESSSQALQRALIYALGWKQYSFGSEPAFGMWTGIQAFKFDKNERICSYFFLRLFSRFYDCND